MTFQEAARFLDKTVTLKLLDGEVSTVKVVWVSDEYQDITVDIIETNNTVNLQRPDGGLRNSGLRYSID